MAKSDADDTEDHYRTIPGDNPKSVAWAEVVSFAPL